MKKNFIAIILLLSILSLVGCTSSKINTYDKSGLTENATEKTTVRVVALKGPTSMGLVSMMNDASEGKTKNKYSFDMVVGADEIVPKIAKGEVDIAAVPANLASIIYNKLEGKISVIDINTLGVLYIVENGNNISSMADLKGKKIYMTGKGTVPEYVLNYLLAKNGLTKDDLSIEFKSEPTEVAAILQSQENSIGLLPQPFVSVASMQNDKIHVALDLTKEWDKVQGDNGSTLVTGVTIVRNEFLNENKKAVDDFLSEHKDSSQKVNSNIDEIAPLIEQYDIVKAQVAKKAIPACNITFIEGSELKQKLSGYLKVLYDQNPAYVGGNLPNESFYYEKK